MSLDRAGRAQVLSQLALFEGLSKADLDTLAGTSRVVEVGPGTVVARQLERGDAMFVVLEGTVRVRRGTRALNYLGPGEVFGELALLDGLPRSATVEATEPGRILVVGTAEFQHLLLARPVVARKLLRTLALRLRAADRRLLG